MYGTAQARYCAGIFCLILVNTLWVSSSELMQFIYADDSTNFAKPLFLTYYNTAWFFIYICYVMAQEKWRHQLKDVVNLNGVRILVKYLFAQVLPCAADVYVSDPYNTEYVEVVGDSTDAVDQRLLGSQNIPTVADETPDNGVRDSVSSTGSRRSFKDHDPDSPVPKFSMLEHAVVGLRFCLIWFTANFMFNLSLVTTSVASNTVISATSSAWTLMLGAVVLRGPEDRITWPRLLGVLLTFVGIFLVAYSDTTKTTGDGNDQHENTRSLGGDLAALFAAILYACYLVYLKYNVPDENQLDTFVFFSWVGFFDIVLISPVLLLAHLTGLETFEIPSATTLGFLTLNAFLGTVVGDLLWLYSMLLTSPFIATVGLSISIPEGILGDILLGKAKPTVLFIFGTIFIVVAFFLVNIHHIPGCMPDTNEDDVDEENDNGGIDYNDNTDIVSFGAGRQAEDMSLHSWHASPRGTPQTGMNT
eukprot:Clim_evm82s225 gene=Clim_evmTU82s225